MRMFIVIAGIVLLAVTFGIGKAAQKGIPLSVMGDGWIVLLLLALLFAAWWLTRRRPS